MLSDQLKALKHAMDEGLITQAEYDDARQALLDQYRRKKEFTFTD